MKGNKEIRTKLILFYFILLKLRNNYLEDESKTPMSIGLTGVWYDELSNY